MNPPTPSSRSPLAALARRESISLTPLVTAAVLLLVGSGWDAILDHPVPASLLFAWLFAMIVMGSVAVVRHADELAELLGEPFGTMILTLSVASIEIMTIAIVMTTGDPNPTLGRDTMFSVVMIVLNGLVGIALLLGGLRHREQHYNLQGANAYLSVIVALAIFGMVMPDFTESSTGPTFSRGQEGFLMLMCLGLYGVFLVIQTTRHRSFFVEVGAELPAPAPAAGEPPHATNHGRPLASHALLLVANLGLVIFLAEHLAVLLDYGLDELHAPPALGAMLVAILVLAPEGLSGIKAAIANRMQRSVNILLGSALATLSLTIPAVVIIGLAHGSTVILGLDHTEIVLLMLTLMVSVLTFVSGRTNVLQGAVHLMLFLAYVMLIVWR